MRDSEGQAIPSNGGSDGSVWVMGQWSVGQWIVGVICFQKILGLFGLKRHIVEISGDVIDAGRTDGRTTSKDKATQLLICEPLSFSISFTSDPRSR